MKIKMCDPSGLLLSLSGIVLGVLLAVAEYRVDFWAALVLIVTAGLIHAYMQTLNKWWMGASVASAVLTVYLSYGTLFSLESLILLLFAYFIIRLARGMGGRGRIRRSTYLSSEWTGCAGRSLFRMYPLLSVLVLPFPVALDRISVRGG